MSKKIAMSAFEMTGYIAAILMFATFYVKMMVPLRIIGICTNVAFFTYGVLDGLTPIIILHTVLLPVNAYRLYQMLRHTRDARQAAEGELNLDWLKPYASSQQANAGDILFHKGDTAHDMFVVNSGRFPRFGFYILKLISLRLTENVERLEEELARYRQDARA